MLVQQSKAFISVEVVAANSSMHWLKSHADSYNTPTHTTPTPDSTHRDKSPPFRTVRSPTSNATSSIMINIQKQFKVLCWCCRAVRCPLYWHDSRASWFWRGLFSPCSQRPTCEERPAFPLVSASGYLHDPSPHPPDLSSTSLPLSVSLSLACSLCFLPSLHSTTSAADIQSDSERGWKIWPNPSLASDNVQGRCCERGSKKRETLREKEQSRPRKVCLKS